MTQWLRIREAAERLGVSEDTARRMADAGMLTSHRTPGKHRRVSAESVDRYLNDRREP